MKIEELEARVRSLEERLRIVEDTEEIKQLQRIYGYYLIYGMWDEFVELFSDNTESIELGTSGVYLGKAGVVKLCKLMEAKKQPKEFSTRTMLQIMKIWQPVIDIDAEGKTAYGRWQGLECVARPLDATWIQYWGHGIYENQYIKEDGKWRFKKLRWYFTFHAPFEDGWLKTPNIYHTVHPTIKPDGPSTGYHPYPEVCTVPFHYKHPISGQ